MHTHALSGDPRTTQYEQQSIVHHCCTSTPHVVREKTRANALPYPIVRLDVRSIYHSIIVPDHNYERCNLYSGILVDLRCRCVRKPKYICRGPCHKSTGVRYRRVGYFESLCVLVQSCTDPNVDCKLGHGKCIFGKREPQTWSLIDHGQLTRQQFGIVEHYKSPWGLLGR